MTTALRTANWSVLEDLAAADELTMPRRRDHVGRCARPPATMSTRLPSPRRSARRATDAIALFMERARTRDSAVDRDAAGGYPACDDVAGPLAGPDREAPARASALRRQPRCCRPVTRVRARDVPSVRRARCASAADENPDAEFEISWRIVEPLMELVANQIGRRA